MASISKRVSGAWQNTSYGIRATATGTITTLPTTIYGDGTNAIISIKGNTVQSGTPTPDNPIIPQGCGELEAGQYKIPISSASTTTPIYLGEVQTTRKIKKLVLDGTENWFEGTSNYYIYIDVSGKGAGIPNSTVLSTHTESGVVVNNSGTALFFKKSVFVHSSLADFKTYLQQQYAADTPVTVWYVLAESIIGIVNEPLMKIGDYADEVNNISIPTIDGANTLSIDTTVQPSEVNVNYHGWHMGAVHECISGQWD